MARDSTRSCKPVDIECERLDARHIFDERLRLVDTSSDTVMGLWVARQVVLPLTAENISAGYCRVAAAIHVKSAQVTDNAVDAGAVRE